jgi:hypothetical protein
MRAADKKQTRIIFMEHSNNSIITGKCKGQPGKEFVFHNRNVKMPQSSLSCQHRSAAKEIFGIFNLLKDGTICV